MMTRKIKPRLKRAKDLFMVCCSYIGWMGPLSLEG